MSPVLDAYIVSALSITISSAVYRLPYMVKLPQGKTGTDFIVINSIANLYCELWPWQSAKNAIANVLLWIAIFHSNVKNFSLQKFSHIWYTLPKLLTQKLKFKIQFWGRHACPRSPSMKLPLPTAIILKQTSSAEVRICDFLFCSCVNSCKSFNLCNIIVIFGLCPWAMPHIHCAPCPVIKFKYKTVCTQLIMYSAKLVEFCYSIIPSQVLPCTAIINHRY